MPKTRTTKPDHRGMILDPDRWPSWPVLPLKRGNAELEDKNLGVILSTYWYYTGNHRTDGGTSIAVYHVYLFDMPTTADGWAAAPKTVYENVDALLADGWVVD